MTVIKANELLTETQRFVEQPLHKDWIEKITHLHDDDSQNDPETEPFKSKYAAREMLKKEFASLLMTKSSPVENPSFLLYCFLRIYLANSYFDTDERTECKNTLIALIKEMRKHPELVKIIDAPEDSQKEWLKLFGGVLSYTLTFLGLVMSTFEVDPEELTNDKMQDPKFCFERALLLMSLMKTEPPMWWESFFCPKKAGLEALLLSNLQTMAYFMLAQYHLRNDDKKSAAEYLEKTLNLSLILQPANEAQKGEKFFFIQLEILDCCKWASNCSTLANYFSTTHDFIPSAECLLTAKQVFARYHGDETDEVYLKAKANLAIGFAKHALTLLKLPDDVVKPKDPIERTFHLSDDEQISLEEIQELAQLPNDFQDACKIFHVVSDNIKIAQTAYYPEDGRCTEYVELQRDLSLAYSLLARIQPDSQKKCCLLKTRIGILEKLLHDLNPEHYLLQRRLLFFELGETYMDMRKAKDELLQQDEDNQLVDRKTRQKWVLKCNNFNRKAIEALYKLLDTYKLTEEELVKKKFASIEDYLTVMRSTFYIARMYATFVDFSSALSLNHLNKAVEMYQRVIDLARANERLAPDIMSDDLDQEVEVAHSMVDLLPKKIERIQATI